MTEFKIENFCEIHNIEFKKYYNYLNNPLYLQYIYYYMNILHTDKIKQYIKELIKKNYTLINDKFKKIDIIIKFYKENNLINKSEIGKFFNYYEENRSNNLYNLFYKMIEYDRCIEMLKECFYIFSDYRSCIYFMTPSINFHNTKKEIIKKVILNFRDNINTLNQIISKTYIGEKNPWISPYYASAYAMYETLFIIKKYFKNPEKLLNIKFIIKKKCDKNKIIENLCNNYHKLKLKETDLDNKIIKDNINNISQFIVILKKLGYDLWYTIDLVFNTIYEKYNIDGLPNAIVFNHKNIYLQKQNNLLGFKCYILNNEGFISNVNIFKNFND